MTPFGPYTLHAIETGRFGLDGGAMFGIVPKALWSRRIEPDAQNRILMGMRCLLIEGEGRLILVDAGLGDKYDAKFASIYAVDQEETNLHRSLAAAGFSADDVTDLVLTHLHFDHCGGATTRDAEGRLGLTFPEATVHVQRAHWDWAQRSNPREKASFLAENLEPIGASGQLNLIDGAGELFPGISVTTVDGHTHAQQLVHVSGGGRTLVYVADLIPTAVHIPPVWGMSYDIDPLRTISEKETFLSEAAQNDWQLFFEHDASVEVVSLEQSDRGIRGIYPRPLHEV
ncbi:MAG: MBL fold metallo-hydrolase [Bacteroidota bacterium]